MSNLMPIDAISSKIYLIRKQKVMLDRDLAELFGVETKQLKRQVRRNIGRFPSDFMFMLTKDEVENLRCQIGTLGKGAHMRYPPMVFTEHGAIMAASVLNSKRAVEVSIFVVRAFVKLRELLSTHKKMAKKLDELEKRLTGHDENFQVVFEVIKQLLEVDEKPKRKIGF